MQADRLTAEVAEQRRRYHRTWTQSLAAGKETRGNLAANLAFLDATGLLRPALRILEIGCGAGTLAGRLAQRGLAVTGIDIAAPAIAYGRARYPAADLRVGSGIVLDFPAAAFDLVLSFDFIEHIHDVDTHLRHVHRVLTPGGHYLCGTPNRYLAAAYDTCRLGNFTWRRAHPSLHTPRQLRRRLARRGFRCRFVKVNTINDFTRAKLPGPPLLARCLGRLNTARLPLCLQTNLYAVAQRLPAEKDAP